VLEPLHLSAEEIIGAPAVGGDEDEAEESGVANTGRQLAGQGPRYRFIPQQVVVTLGLAGRFLGAKEDLSSAEKAPGRKFVDLEAGGEGRAVADRPRWQVA